MPSDGTSQWALIVPAVAVAIDRTGQIAGAPRASLAIPRSLVTFGVASVANLALSRLRRNRKTPEATWVEQGPRAIH